MIKRVGWHRLVSALGVLWFLGVSAVSVHDFHELLSQRRVQIDYQGRAMPIVIVSAAQLDVLSDKELREKVIEVLDPYKDMKRDKLPSSVDLLYADYVGKHWGKMAIYFASLAVLPTLALYLAVSLGLWVVDGFRQGAGA